ncbi:MAG: epoxyqueuosine reductase [Candidatus Heimdallarchaeota archaeon]|nr:MAG: epoxyqueuosine reductase [Candidatus Heimdallarchaeota archaeon]
MGLKARMMRLMMESIGKRQYQKLVEREAQFAELENVLLSEKNSPERFEIVTESLEYPFEKTKLFYSVKTMRIMPSNFRNIKKSITSIDQNPSVPQAKIPDHLLQEFHEYAKSLGVSSIGYSKLPRKLIFKNKAVLHDNCIVLSMEMNKEKIEKAPSSETANMIMRTYDDLGKASNQLTAYLRGQGFSAQAGHPLGGLVLYPPLAELAGIGYHGIHGLIITPEHGPRVRLTAIYTNIENLPFTEKNPHEWIGFFCAKCGRCARKCPGIAFFDEPASHKNGFITHIRNEFCFPVFLEYHGCTVCIKECPFSRVDYNKLKKHFNTQTVDPDLI